MITSKGYVQPHHTNVPRRRPRTRPPPNYPSPMKDEPTIPVFDPGHQATRSPLSHGCELMDTRITLPTTSDKERRPSPETPITVPSDAIQTCDTPADKLLTTPPPHKTPAEAVVDPATSPGFRFPLNPSSPPHHSPIRSRLTARGNLEPHVTNLPRRSSPSQKERERVRKRCLQELIIGSGVWIALNPRIVGDELIDEDRDWMWEEELGYSGVIRVRVGKHREGCSRVCRKRAGEEELVLVIGSEKAIRCDDLGISALSDAQLREAAAFLIESRRGAEGNGKALITVPSARPVEALSLALFALSLPSTSFPSCPSSSPSYLSRLRFLPGILELEQSQEVNIDATMDSSGLEVAGNGHRKFSLIQLALWHIHDFIPESRSNDSGVLKEEWRGALSFAGIARLEKLVARFGQHFSARQIQPPQGTFRLANHSIHG